MRLLCLFFPHKWLHVTDVVAGWNEFNKDTKEDWEAAMGIDWMTRNELAQAIPPVYCEWIGRHLIKVLEARP